MFFVYHIRQLFICALWDRLPYRLPCVQPVKYYKLLIMSLIVNFRSHSIFVNFCMVELLCTASVRWHCISAVFSAGCVDCKASDDCFLLWYSMIMIENIEFSSIHLFLWVVLNYNLTVAVRGQHVSCCRTCFICIQSVHAAICSDWCAVQCCIINGSHRFIRNKCVCAKTAAWLF